MPILVVGGQSRNLGKTSVVAGLIAAMSERKWTAAKITQYGHGVCSVNGKQCHCAVDEHRWAITEERDRSGESDTSRFLVAGAAQSLWVRTKQGRLDEAMPAFRKKIVGVENVILESNSVLGFLHPDLYLTVLDYGIADFKQSARQFLEQATAVILHDPGQGYSATAGLSPESLKNKTVFHIHPPEYITPEIVDFVRKKISVVHA